MSSLIKENKRLPCIVSIPRVKLPVIIWWKGVFIGEYNSIPSGLSLCDCVNCGLTAGVRWRIPALWSLFLIVCTLIWRPVLILTATAMVKGSCWVVVIIISSCSALVRRGAPLLGKFSVFPVSLYRFIHRRTVRLFNLSKWEISLAGMLALCTATVASLSDVEVSRLAVRRSVSNYRPISCRCLDVCFPCLRDVIVQEEMSNGRM